MAPQDANAIGTQNFSALHASFTERLKKLRDVKPGSAPPLVPSAGPPMQARKASTKSRLNAASDALTPFEQKICSRSS